MTRKTSLMARTGWAALVLLAAPAARASSVDDSATRTVVPYVAVGNGADSRVQVTNHDANPIKVRVLWVGERTGPHPGRRVCTSLSVPGLTLLSFDPVSMCGLSAPDVGMVVLVEDSAGPARFSARALTDTRSPMTGRLLQTVYVAGVPLANLEGTETRLVAGGLRSRGTGAPQLITTDCYVGSFFDGSGAGGLAARVTLVDSNDNALGSDVTVLKPFELVRFKDVFGAQGITSAMEGVQARFGFGGGNDALVAYCVATQDGMLKLDRTTVLTMAQVANPQDEVRRREFVSFETPARGPFEMLPPPYNMTQTHGLYVRHPDTVRCSVATSGPDALEIVAVSPDKSQRITGTPPSMVEFATGSPHGAIAGGVSDLWGLEVDWPSGTTPPPGGVPYRISCTSGNGTSLADLLFPPAP